MIEMDKPTTTVEPPLDDELLEESRDDAIIGRAFRWSLVFIVVSVGLVGLMIWMLGRPEPKSAPVTPDPVTPTALIAAAEAPAIPFVDITTQTGIDFVHENGATGEKLLPETMGGGCAFLDYDNDGDQDILLVNSTHWPGAMDQSSASSVTHALYQNDGSGHFTNVTVGSGLDVSFYGMGAAVGDYDGDGDVDVFITAVGPNHLFRNEGGRFTDVTATAGVAGGDTQWSSSAGFFDYDNDGRLDLFVCNYVKWSREIDFAVNYTLSGIGRAYGPPTNFEGTDCYLYRNQGDGTFADVSAQAGIQVRNPQVRDASGARPLGKSLGLALADVDHDGWIDVLVANDTVRRFFFHNNGDGTFTERGQRMGVAFDRNGNATGAMGVDCAYFRNDATIGFVIGNFANEMSSLLVSQGGPEQFADDAIVEGIGSPTRLRLTFGALFFDADLDGRVDLLHANGHIEDDINLVQASQRYRQPAQLFWNSGSRQSATFVEVPVSRAGDLSREIVGRGAACGDIDGDGDLDVLLTQVAGPPMLLRNDQDRQGHWLRLKLVGSGGNPDAIGATVELAAAGVTQRRQVMPTRSYLSQVELPVTFGLGAATRVDRLQITWPDGATQQVDVPAVDQTLTVRQAAPAT